MPARQGKQRRLERKAQRNDDADAENELDCLHPRGRVRFKAHIAPVNEPRGEHAGDRPHEGIGCLEAVLVKFRTLRAPAGTRLT